MKDQFPVGLTALISLQSSESESHSVVSNSLQPHGLWGPHGLRPHEFSRPE